MKSVTVQQKVGPSETCSVASNDAYLLMYLCQKYLNINHFTPLALFFLLCTCSAYTFLSKFMLQLQYLSNTNQSGIGSEDCSQALELTFTERTKD